MFWMDLINYDTTCYSSMKHGHWPHFCNGMKSIWSPFWRIFYNNATFCKSMIPKFKSQSKFSFFFWTPLAFYPN